MRLRVVVTVSGLALAALGGAQPAYAHARLVRSMPADRAVLAVAPRTVRVLFDNSVVPGPGIAAVRNGDGSVLAVKPHLARGNRRELVIPLRPNLPDGDYSVRWRVISDDGHLIAGVLAIAVGSGRAPPTSALAPGGTEPGALDIVSHWLFLGGLLLAAGTGAFAVAVWRPVLRRAKNAGHGRLCALLVTGCVLAVVGGALELRGVSTSTRFGTATLAGVLGAACVGILASISYPQRRLRVVAESAALPLLVIPTLAGHALDPGRSALEPVADVLHVASAAVWLGGLVTLFAVVPVLREQGRTTAVVRRFSTLALYAVALLAVTGLVRALSELTAFRQLWEIGYGRTILVKTGLFAALVGLAWLTRARLVPRLPDAAAARRLRESVGVELALFGGLVVAVAVLTQVRPGRDTLAAAQPKAPPAADLAPPPPPVGAVVLARNIGSLAVALAVSSAPRRVTATVLGPSGGAVSELAASFLIDGRTLVVNPCGPGCYDATVPSGLRLGEVEVRLGSGRPAVFHVPATARTADALVRRAGRVIRRLRSLIYVESLSSGPGTRLVTTWRMAAPDRLTYHIKGGAAAIVIGRRRWDKTRRGGPWMRSSQLPPLRVPQPTWGESVRDAHVIGTGRVDGRPVWIVTFANPTIPAWFTVWIDRRRYRTLRLRMTAAAHFMFQRYAEFDRPLKITPPSP